jgi:hypothetical protein
MLPPKSKGASRERNIENVRFGLVSLSEREMTFEVVWGGRDFAILLEGNSPCIPTAGR